MCAGAVSPFNFLFSRCIKREWLKGILFSPRTQPYKAHSRMCYMCKLNAPLIAFRLCSCLFLLWGSINMVISDSGTLNL
jgi:hypothetical protein